MQLSSVLQLLGVGLDFSRYLLGGITAIQEKCDCLKNQAYLDSSSPQTDPTVGPFLQAMGLSLGGSGEGSSVPE